MSNNKHFKILGLLALSALMNGCYVYSVYQGAKTLDRGEITFTPAVSLITYTSNGESGLATTNVGLQAAYGVSKHINILGRYENLDNGEFGYNYSDLAIKIGLIPDRLSISLPAAMYFGEAVDETKSIHVGPTLLGTYPMHDMLDLNMSLKDIFYLNGDFANLIAGSIGVEFYSKVVNPRISILPEVGILIDPREKGYYVNYGVGGGFKF